ncbi:choice-of-anchor L domain-containing protein [Flavobacterium sp.]|jgi:gliding motility-associated-like protein|uniref:choice-of-anchor L domain-containing protein n=1 Tax=Flavobacterium sp. TaxID=239 RepID=UPI0037C08387
MKKIIFIFFGVLFNVGVSQNITVNQTYTAQQLIENILVNSGCVSVSNFSVTSGNFISGDLSYGYFNANGSIFPFQEGIVLSTGKLNSTVGPNSNFSDSGIGMGWNGDSDLNTALSLTDTFNATVLEFDFIPNANTISFEYIFASEQYLLNPSSDQCNFSDGFAFLLKEVSATNYQNLALVPGTSIPVKINTVRGTGTICPAANEMYFDAFNTGNYPTTFDGQTKILTAQATVIPGNLYHIKLVIADEGNERYDSGIFLKAGSFVSEKDLGPNRLIDTGNSLCANEILTLNATQTGATNYKWFKNGTQVGTNSATYDVSSAGIYAVEITINTTCIITGNIEIEYAPNITPSTTSFTACDFNSDGLANFDLNSIRTQIFNNLASNYAVALFDSTSGTIALPANFTNTVPNQQIIYARIISLENCYSNIPITLNVISSGGILVTEIINICNNVPKNISAPNGFSNYSWNTLPVQNSQTISISNAGNYIVTLTSANGCNNTKTFTAINTEITTITNIEVNDFEEDLTAAVTISGNGNYTYSIDGINFQNTPIFNLPDAGEYIVYVKEENCGTVSDTFFAISYPKFFTPNGDSFNDTWQIKNLEKKGLENSKIYIFDKFGKLIKEINKSNTSWDGTFNKQILPSTDYWFVLEATNGKNIKGHFSLKR